jgi:hypothetical protein
MENLTSSQREDVRLVCEQAYVDQQTAIDRLQKDDWDLVNAILNLDENYQKELSSQNSNGGINCPQNVVG